MGFEEKAMMASHLIGHVRVLWRTERIIAELRMKRLLGNLGLQAMAALIAACALLLFELAAYLALEHVWSAIWSAAALGAFNLVVAGLIFLIALRRPASPELALAGEIHQQALAAFEAEIRNAENGSPASVRTALENAAIPLLLPLIPLVIQRLSKRKTDKAPDEAA
jgi:hypothetical protein